MSGSLDISSEHRVERILLPGPRLSEITEDAPGFLLGEQGKPPSNHLLEYTFVEVSPAVSDTATYGNPTSARRPPPSDPVLLGCT